MGNRCYKKLENFGKRYTLEGGSKKKGKKGVQDKGQGKSQGQGKGQGNGKGKNKGKVQNRVQTEGYIWASGGMDPTSGKPSSTMPSTTRLTTSEKGKTTKGQKIKNSGKGSKGIATSIETNEIVDPLDDEVPIIFDNIPFPIIEPAVGSGEVLEPPPPPPTPKQPKMTRKLKKAYSSKGNTASIASLFARQAVKGPLTGVNSELPPQTDQVDQLTIPASSPALSEQSEKDATNPRRSQRISSKPTIVYDNDGAEEVVSDMPDAASDSVLETASTAEPVADNTEEPAAESMSGTTFLVPPWLKARHHRPQATYVLNHIFTSKMCNRLARKYRLAVYSHCDDGPDIQSEAVMAVFNHELDHKDTTPDQKAYYHRLCDEGCGFNKWLAAGNTAATYVKTTYRNHLGKEVAWDSGAFAGMDTLFPQALKELEAIFREIGDPNLMSRCSRIRTQNINNSIHYKI